MAVLQVSLVSPVKFHRPEDLEPAQSKSSHTRPEPLTVSTVRRFLGRTGSKASVRLLHSFQREFGESDSTSGFGRPGLKNDSDYGCILSFLCTLGPDHVQL